jgi:hypothetical protein
MRRDHMAGRRWQTRERAGPSHAEAGRAGGRGHRYRGGGPGLGAAKTTRAEAALRWAMGDATQRELAREYGVCRTTMRRWCAAFEEEEG